MDGPASRKVALSLPSRSPPPNATSLELSLVDAGLPRLYESQAIHRARYRVLLYVSVEWWR